jgi:hypothetical protein
VYGCPLLRVEGTFREQVPERLKNNPWADAEGMLHIVARQSCKVAAEVANLGAGLGRPRHELTPVGEEKCMGVCPEGTDVVSAIIEHCYLSRSLRGDSFSFSTSAGRTEMSLKRLRLSGFFLGKFVGTFID